MDGNYKITIKSVAGSEINQLATERDFKMNFFNICFLIVLNFYCIKCTPYYWNLMEEREVPKKYCGKKLTDMLSLVCNHEYYSRDIRRPHAVDGYNYDSEYPNDVDENDKVDSDVVYPFLDKYSGLSLLPNKARRTIGISNECCEKPCTISHIRSYCAR